MREPERSSIDDIIDVYKRDVDASLIVESLQWSMEERLERLQQFLAFIEELRGGLVHRDR